MSPGVNPETPSRMEEVQQQFLNWRQTREKRGPIPEGLRNAAADLVGEYTPYQVVKGLQVSDRELKKRIARRASGQPKGPATPMTHFVELELPAATPAEAGEYTLELEEATGRKLRLRGVGRLDVFQLAQAFWGSAV